MGTGGVAGLLDSCTTRAEALTSSPLSSAVLSSWAWSTEAKRPASTSGRTGSQPWPSRQKDPSGYSGSPAGTSGCVGSVRGAKPRDCSEPIPLGSTRSYQPGTSVGACAKVVPPPHAQHMRLAVKSSSSPVGAVAEMAHIASVIAAQPVIAALSAPWSVSMQGGGGDAGGGSGGGEGGVGNGHEQTQLIFLP